MEDGDVGVIILSGTSRAARHIRWKRRATLLGRLLGWKGDSKGVLENRITSWVNRDDYIYGENKPLLYLHPDLVWGPNMAFFKRTVNLSGRTGIDVYRKRRSILRKYLSVKGVTSLEIVARSLSGSKLVDQKNIVVVGPVDPIKKELDRSGAKHIRIAKQGGSLGDNILIGRKALIGSGFKGGYIMILGGDMPLIDSGQIDSFVQACRARGGGPDMFYGMSSRKALGPRLEELDVVHLGRLGPNRPARGNIKKFGIQFIDDLGLFGPEGERVALMNSNLFLYKRSSFDPKTINRLYSMRKMFANPFIYHRLIRDFGIPLIRTLMWRLSLSEGEGIFSRTVGFKLNVVPTNPLLALDLDSFTDLRRASAILFGVKGERKDLEVGLKEYVKRRRREKG
ncbi:MAG: hypothetical protein QCI82_00640 [Candidatus Thermoplasmatota archaeon]|nr:hypothetical protein [Candidatus Thermoplasmatota archaeon]